MGIALFWILINQRLIATHSPIVVTTYGMLAGFLMLAVIVPFAWGAPPVHGISWKAWGALAGSGILCTASTTLLWNWGMTRVPASQAGVLLNMEPLMGSLLGITVLGEHLGGWAYAGGALIVGAAVTLTSRSSKVSGGGICHTICRIGTRLLPSAASNRTAPMPSERSSGDLVPCSSA